MNLINLVPRSYIERSEARENDRHGMIRYSRSEKNLLSDIFSSFSFHYLSFDWKGNLLFGEGPMIYLWVGGEEMGVHESLSTPGGPPDL